MKKTLLIIGLFCLIAGYLHFQYKSSIFSPIDENSTEEVSFRIKEGRVLKEITKDLKEAGLIKSPFFFNYYLKKQDLDTKILAGRFLLSPNQTAAEIAETLSNAQKSESVITIQEGLRIKDIDQKLAEMKLSEKGQFTSAINSFNGWEYYDFLSPATPLEGYLFPDTYFLKTADFNPQDLIYLSLDNFEKKLNSIENIPTEHSLNDYIIMASIIEKEVFGFEDRKIVSAILWKRLNSNWALGADATLLYLKEDRTITTEDLQKDSPYNTRKNLGLPPTAISNPSLESIQASMFPEQNDYWFYLTTPDTGKVIYAKTNEEHNANKAKYL
ncbi:endolytic transglycosylase MltG [Patescibacteria group bacterium]|nr:endolytic transglycosylase MltG [Patescibacteria group bacterium]